MRAAILAGLIALAAPAWASDGRLEINQACVAAGCWDGDAPGFPVTLLADRSHVLTGSLVLPDGDSVGIQMATGSTLDLAGFVIAGPVTCTGTPAACTAGSGVGVYAPSSKNVTIRNGTIRGTGGYGVRAGEGTRLESLRIEQHTQDGVIADFGPSGWLISECTIERNGRHGLNFAYAGGARGSVVRNGTLRGNGQSGAIGSFSLIEGNAINDNGGLGLGLSYDGSTTAFSGNHIRGNNGGDAFGQTNGGIETGTNVCGTTTGCP